MRIKTITFVLFFFMSASVCVAQSDTDKALARQYYTAGEYDKAAVLYEDLLDEDPSSEYFYRSLFNCYLQLNDYDALEKVIQKRIKKNKRNPQLLVDLGYVYSQKNETAKAEKEYEKAIDNLGSDQSMVHRVAGQFRAYRNYEWEVRAYEKGSKQAEKGTYCYHLANAYLNNDNKKAATATMVDCISNQPRYTQNIKNLVQKNLDDEDLLDELEFSLYDGIQQKGNEDAYGEMLVWLFTQRKNFRDAFIQARALDMRNKEDGRRIFQLAKHATLEDDFEAAIDAYDYITEKGSASPYYLRAKQQRLEVRKDQVLSGAYTQADLQELKALYEEHLEEYSNARNQVDIIRSLAALEAYYLQDVSQAITRLDALLSQPLRPQERNRVKLELGDYYVLDGNVWEATLLYAQVDKEEKDSPLGEEARFRNARLSYYKGEFEWAQAQLTVLKGSTSELIANDALDLSIFIMDNLGLDTSSRAMELYTRAELLAAQNQWQEALNTFDSIPFYFPQHPLLDDVLFQKAKIKHKLGLFEEQATLLKQVVANYAEDLLADNACYQLGLLYENQLDDAEQAMTYYKTIITDYTDSVLATEARKRFRALRGDAPDVEP